VNCSECFKLFKLMSVLQRELRQFTGCNNWASTLPANSNLEAHLQIVGDVGMFGPCWFQCTVTGTFLGGPFRAR